MANIKQVTITYADKTDHVFVRRLRHSTTMRLFGMLRAGLTDKGDIDGNKVSPENLSNFQLNLISESVVDESGNRLFTIDQVDEWGEEDGGSEKINAYVAALNPNKGKEVVAGN